MIPIRNMATQYIFFFYKISFIITPKIVLNLNIGCIFFNLSECEEYLYIHWLTPDYLNVYMCPWQPTLHVLSQWLSTEIFPLSCFIKCCYPPTHTHTHHTMGITSINISGEQLIYSVKNVFENNLVCRYLNNKT